MDRRLQNAYSRQASVEVEQQLGDASTISVGYQYLRGLDLLMAVNQNVPDLRGVAARTTAAGQIRTTRTTANTRRPASPTITGSTSSLSQRPARWGHYRVSYTFSKSMNNVGEFFFSGPIDPFDLSKDWGRSDDDQRHRLVISGAVQTPTTAASTFGSTSPTAFRSSAHAAGVLRAAVEHVRPASRRCRGRPGGRSSNGEFIRSAIPERQRLLQPERARQPRRSALKGRRGSSKRSSKAST